MSRPVKSDEAVVEQARRVIVAKQRVRWLMLSYAALFLGLCGWMTLRGIRNIEGLEAEQVSRGFIYGLALAVGWTSFGLLGALCLGKFLVGCRSEVRIQELLVRYHDRLRELRELPDEGKGELGHPPKIIH